MIANANECVAPRCPHVSSYLTPMENPMTSMSGSMESADQPAAARQLGRNPSSYTRAAAIPTATCPRLATASRYRTLGSRSRI